MKIGDNFSRFFDQIKKMQMDALTRQLKGKQLQNAEEINNAIIDLMNKELSWDRLKDKFVNLYGEAFSVEELEALIKFYESPIGKKLVDKQPEIAQKSMVITQSLRIELMPKIQALTKEIVEKQQKAAAQAKAQAANQNAAPAAQATPLPAAVTPAAKNVVPLK